MVTALAVVIALALPLVLLGNGLWLLLQPWLVHVEYALPGFPEDRLGLTERQRTELAVVGLRSIRPGDGEGPAHLRQARLPTGEVAFNVREVAHMADVRGVIGGFLIAWAVALGLLGAAALALRRGGEPGSLARALGAGVRFTVALFALASLLMLVSFEWFFEGFHGLLFEGRSWRFRPGDTLRSLYPDAFWGVAGGLLATLVALQAVALGLVLRARTHAAPAASPAGSSPQRRRTRRSG